MSARLNCVPNKAVFDKEANKDVKMSYGEQLFGALNTNIEYYNVQKGEDSLPAASTPNPLDVDQKDNIDKGTTKSVDDGSDNGLSAEIKDGFRRVATNNINVFHTSLRLVLPLKSSRYISIWSLTRSRLHFVYEITRRSSESS